MAALGGSWFGALEAELAALPVEIGKRSVLMVNRFGFMSHYQEKLLNPALERKNTL